MTRLVMWLHSPASWKRTLWVMAAVQMIMGMAFSSTGAFLAYYIMQLGVHDPRAVDVWAGLISSSNFLISAIASPLWGMVGDRKGRKMMVMRTTLAISVFTMLMGVCQVVWQLLVVRMIQGMFSGFSAASTALVSVVIPEEEFGSAMGWLQSARLLGTLVGPLFGGLAADAFQNYRAALFLTGAFAMTAFLLTWLLVQEPKVQAEMANKKKPTLVEQFKSVGRMKEIRTMFLVLFLAQFSVMSVMPVLPVYLKELAGPVPYLGTLAGMVGLITGIADLISAPFLGKRTEKIGYRRLLTICMTGAGLMYLPQALAPNLWVYLAARFGLGLFVGGILPAANALGARLTPREQRGQVFGFTSSAFFLGSFAGPLWGGIGSAAFGIRTMLATTCVMYLANMLWVRAKVRDPKPLETAL
jgi:MFS transporter, DHA1 family, multidrug resistance protein